MAVGLGAVLVAVTTAANADVAPDQAGLAARLLSDPQQLGTALGCPGRLPRRTARILALQVPGAGAGWRGMPCVPAGIVVGRRVRVV
jgi:hypothetical protein